MAPTIKVAEASKVIENSQRDINIAFVNEFAKIFNLMDINTHDVWKQREQNGIFYLLNQVWLVGTVLEWILIIWLKKLKRYGYHPEIILAGRRLNDGMGDYVASEVVKCMIKKDI